MRFQAVMQELEKNLDVPYPERSDVVAEIASHLDALFSDLVAGGTPPEEAESRALATMGADVAFVNSMQSIHQTTVARALAQLSPRVTLGIEFGVVTILGALFVSTTLLQEATVIQFIIDGGFFMIPINIAGMGILVLGLERVYSLYIKRDHSVANLGKRVLSLRFLATLCAVTGVVGTLVGLHAAFSIAPEIAAKFGGVFPTYEVISISLTTAIWGMTMALIAVVFRFVIEAKTSRIEALRVG